MALNSANTELQAVANRRSLDINPITYLEKIPEFDGRKEALFTFCMNVDEIVPTLMLYNEQGQRMCINIIKSKLTGKARRSIEIHPHLTSWKDIKTMLEFNFGGFKSSDQLFNDLRGARYKGDTLEFYNYIQRKLALLNQRCQQENRLNYVESNIQTALNVFISQLPVYMRTFLYSLKPSSMEEAIYVLSQSGFLDDEKSKNKSTLNHPLRNQLIQKWQQYQQQQWRPQQEWNWQPPAPEPMDVDI